MLVADTVLVRLCKLAFYLPHTHAQANALRLLQATSSTLRFYLCAVFGVQFQWLYARCACTGVRLAVCAGCLRTGLGNCCQLSPQKRSRFKCRCASWVLYAIPTHSLVLLFGFLEFSLASTCVSFIMLCIKAAKIIAYFKDAVARQVFFTDFFLLPCLAVTCGKVLRNFSSAFHLAVKRMSF